MKPETRRIKDSQAMMIAQCIMPIGQLVVSWPDDISDNQRRALICRASGMSFRAIADYLAMDRDAIFRCCGQHADIINAVRTNAEMYRKSVFDNILLLTTEIGFALSQQYLARTPDARDYASLVKALESLSHMLNPAPENPESTPTGKRVTRAKLTAATREFRALRDQIVGRPDPS